MNCLRQSSLPTCVKSLPVLPVEHIIESLCRHDMAHFRVAGGRDGLQIRSKADNEWSSGLGLG